MNDRKKRSTIIHRLWLNNSRVINYYRMAIGAVKDPELKGALFDYAARRAQLGFELNQQMNKFGENPSLPGDKKVNEARTISLNLSEDTIEGLLLKCIRAEKDCLTDYSKALTVVNEGTTREILIRHRARINSFIKELQHLYTQLPITGKKENLKTN